MESISCTRNETLQVAVGSGALTFSPISRTDRSSLPVDVELDDAAAAFERLAAAATRFQQYYESLQHTISGVIKRPDPARSAAKPSSTSMVAASAAPAATKSGADGTAEKPALLLLMRDIANNSTVESRHGLSRVQFKSLTRHQYQVLESKGYTGEGDVAPEALAAILERGAQECAGILATGRTLVFDERTDFVDSDGIIAAFLLPAPTPPAASDDSHAARTEAGQQGAEAPATAFTSTAIVAVPLPDAAATAAGTSSDNAPATGVAADGQLPQPVDAQTAHEQPEVADADASVDDGQQLMHVQGQTMYQGQNGTYYYYQQQPQQQLSMDGTQSHQVASSDVHCCSSWLHNKARRMTRAQCRVRSTLRKWISAASSIRCSRATTTSTRCRRRHRRARA